jgi:hypothetical protein
MITVPEWAERMKEMRRLDTLYAGRSEYYDALRACCNSTEMPEWFAARVAAVHGVTLAELDDELYWTLFDSKGAGTHVHIGSLLAALGY